MEEALVDWSRAQFALTAMYHWLFVPLTLGLSFIMAIMETIYFKTGNVKWDYFKCNQNYFLQCLCLDIWCLFIYKKRR